MSVRVTGVRQASPPRRGARLPRQVGRVPPTIRWLRDRERCFSERFAPQRDDELVCACFPAVAFAEAAATHVPAILPLRIEDRAVLVLAEQRAILEDVFPSEEDLERARALLMLELELPRDV